MKSENRFGTFSSSSAWKLMTKDRSGKDFGAPGKKYIKQVQYEILLGRAINPERDSRPTSWGTTVEKVAFDNMDESYQLVSQERLFHKTIKRWSGQPDLIKGKNVVADIKCPFSLEVFCDKLEALKSLETYKDSFPEDYWQHVSNAILLDEAGLKITHFEAVLFVPYKSQLEEIREHVNTFDGDQNKVAWINWASEDDVPYLLDGGTYKNLNIIRHAIPEEDKNLLTEAVLQAVTRLKEKQ